MKKLAMLLLILMLAFALVACGGDSEDEPQQDEENGEAVQEEEDEDEEEEQDATGEVYEGDGWASAYYDADTMDGLEMNMYAVTDAVEPILREFEEDTGISINHLTMGNAEMLQRIENEYESGVNIADLWFTGGADTFIIGAQEGLTIPYVSPSGEDIPDSMKDPDGYWHGTSLTLVNWVVNTDLVEELGLEMPREWDDLLQEGLEGEISMPDPATSGTAYNVISAILEVKGEEEGWEYLEVLNSHVPFYTSRGSDPAQNVINGEAVVGINPSNGDLDMELENPHIELVFPEDGTGWWPQPVSIVNGTENEEAAKVFIDWILSDRGMESIARNRYAAVAKPGVEVPDGIIQISDIELFETDFQANAENREAILEEWEAMLEQAE